MGLLTLLHCEREWHATSGLQHVGACCVQELLEGLVAPSRTTARSLLEDASPNKWSIPSKANLGMLAKPGKRDPGGPQLPHKTFQVRRLKPFVDWQFDPDWLAGHLGPVP